MEFPTKTDRRTAREPSGNLIPTGPSRRSLLKAFGAVTVVGAAPLAAVGASGTLDVTRMYTGAIPRTARCIGQPGASGGLCCFNGGDFR